MLIRWLCCCVVAWAELDPYRVLGVDRGASPDKIKRAYKQKAVQYHPDKNPDPAAHDKFVEINSAYEILGDPEKKKQYDHFGRTQEQHTQAHPFSYQRRYMDYYSQSAFPDTVSTKITLDTYNHRVTSSGSDPSQLRVWLLYVYSDFGCQLCQRMAPVWEEAAKQLQGYVHTGKVNSDFESSLVAKLGVRSVPAFVAVRTVKGKTQVKLLSSNTWQMRTADMLVDFAAQQFDPNTLTLLQGKTIAELRKTWQQFEEADKTLVHFLVLSRKPAPHIMWFWHAARLKHAKVAYLSTSSLPLGVLEQLSSLFRLSSSDEERLLRSQAILVRRDAGPDKLLSELPADKTALHTLLKAQRLIVPKLSETNFYELCFGTKRCLVFFSHASVLSPENNLQLGWISPREQADFVAFFKEKDRTPTAVLLQTDKNRFAPFWDEIDREALARWLPTAKFKNATNMPFLNPDATSVWSQFVDGDVFSLPSIFLLLFLGFGSFALLFRFLLQ